MQLRRTKFKFLKVTLVLVLTLSILTLSFPTNNKAEASYLTPSCGQLIDSIERLQQYLEEHINHYKWIIGTIIPSPSYVNYLDYWMENAEESLDSIRKAHEWISRDLQKMLICEDNNSYYKKTPEDLENILSQILELVGSPYVMTEMDWGGKDNVVEVINILINIKKLSQRDGYEQIFDNVVLKDEDTTENANNFIANLLLSHQDRWSLRAKSYNTEAESSTSNWANFVVTLDGINIFIDHFKENLERQTKNLEKIKPDFSTAKYVANSIVFDYNFKNFASMAPRAMYMTYFEQQLAIPYISASDEAYRKDLAGNFASFMVATDKVSFALTLSELLLDMYDYIEKEMAAVAKLTEVSAKDYQRARQEINYKIQTTEQVGKFSNKLYNIYFEKKLTEKQAKDEINKDYIVLEEGIKDIYKLDPNEIKLYINGKRIEMPEPAYISHGTTMVPLRIISEELGVKPIWNATNRTITFTTEHSPMSPFKPIDVVLTVGSKTVRVGDVYQRVAVAPTIKNGVTFVPLAFIADHLGLDSIWEAGSKSVILKDRK